jgi:organic radical activating enzyme
MFVSKFVKYLNQTKRLKDILINKYITQMTSSVNTSLTCNSAKVWAFYHEHPEIDFEKMNIMFTDILASIIQTTNPVNNSNITSQILNGLANIQSQLTSQQSEYSKLLFLKLTEFKKEYIDDLKMILSSNIADKIAPLIKESNGSILDKTQLLLSELVPKNNENLSRQINDNIKSFCSSITAEISKTSNTGGEPLSQSSLDSFIKNIDTKFSNVIDSTRKMVDSNKDATLSQLSSISSSQIALQSEVKDVLKKMENSSSKGKMSENIVLNILRGLFPSAEVEYVGSQKESGDIMIHRKDRQKILVENKCYESRQVTSDQVKKFIHDVDIQNCSGLFLSQEGGIVNKDNFEINIHNRNVLLYIHNVNYDPEIIKIAIDIIDSFKTKLDEVTLTDDYPISKDTLEEINKEYQLFVEQKLNQLKMVKEFSQKMIKNIEDLQLPCLEKMLSSRFGYITSGKFVCEKCNFIGKNPLALSVHKRTCDKTNSSVQENIIVSPITVQIQQPVSVPVPLQQPVQQKLTKIITKTIVSPTQNK